MLLADEKGASLIVAVGTHATLVEFLDKGRGGMASTFLTRLKVGRQAGRRQGRQPAVPAEHLGLLPAAAGAVRDRRDGLRAGRVHRGQGLPRTGRRVVGQLRLLGAEAVLVINFRYHVVSMTAVFLALAIGLVVGTAALNGPAVDTLKDRVNSLTSTNQQYRDQVNQLEADAGKQEQFANASAPILLQDKLAGRRVLVVSMAGASQYVDDTVKMLALSGAKLTGKIEIEDRFTDPTYNENLLDLAGTTVPAGLTNVPTNSDGVETASYVLASVLLDANPALPADSLRTVVAAYKEAGFIAVTGQPTGTAEAVILLAAPPYTDPKADARNKNVVTMVDQFDRIRPGGGRGQRRGRQQQRDLRGTRRPDAAEVDVHCGQPGHPAGPGGRGAGGQRAAGAQPGRPLRPGRRRQRDAAEARPVTIRRRTGCGRADWCCAGSWPWPAASPRGPRCAGSGPIAAGRGAGPHQLPGPRRSPWPAVRRWPSPPRPPPPWARPSPRGAGLPAAAAALAAGLGSGAVGLYDDVVGGRPGHAGQGLPGAPQRAAARPGHHRAGQDRRASARPGWPPPRCSAPPGRRTAPRQPSGPWTCCSAPGSSPVPRTWSTCSTCARAGRSRPACCSVPRWSPGRPGPSSPGRPADHVANFFACVKSRKEPNAPVETGIAAARAGHIANLAYKHTGQIVWPPKNSA